jgi:hypothetical protein
MRHSRPSRVFPMRHFPSIRAWLFPAAATPRVDPTHAATTHRTAPSLCDVPHRKPVLPERHVWPSRFEPAPRDKPSHSCPDLRDVPGRSWATNPPHPRRASPARQADPFLFCATCPTRRADPAQVGPTRHADPSRFHRDVPCRVCDKPRRLRATYLALSIPRTPSRLPEPFPLGPMRQAAPPLSVPVRQAAPPRAMSFQTTYPTRSLRPATPARACATRHAISIPRDEPDPALALPMRHSAPCPREPARRVLPRSVTPDLRDEPCPCCPIPRDVPPPVFSFYATYLINPARRPGPCATCRPKSRRPDLPSRASSNPCDPPCLLQPCPRDPPYPFCSFPTLTTRPSDPCRPGPTRLPEPSRSLATSRARHATRQRDLVHPFHAVPRDPPGRSKPTPPRATRQRDLPCPPFSSLGDNSLCDLPSLVLPVRRTDPVRAVPSLATLSFSPVRRAALHTPRQVRATTHAASARTHATTQAPPARPAPVRHATP